MAIAIGGNSFGGAVRSSADYPKKMLAQYFGFQDEPFADEESRARDFTTLNFRGVHAQLLVAIGDRRGLILLFGDAGSGKSATLRLLSEELGVGATASLSCRSETTFDEILGAACAAFGVAPNAGGRADVVRAFVAEAMNRLRTGRPMALLVDDADALDDSVLESLHLLSQVGDRKLLQVVLAAAPPLETRLRRPQLRALDNDAAIRCRLTGLTDEEVGAYIRHQLHRAGHSDAQLFPAAVVERIARCTRGNARHVSNLARQALLFTQLEGGSTVTLKSVDQAASVLGLEVRDAPAETPERRSATIEPLSIYRSQRTAAARLAPAAGDGPEAGWETTPTPSARPTDDLDDAESDAGAGGRVRPAFPDARMLAAQSRLRSAAQLTPPPSRRVLPLVLGGVALALTTLAGGAAALHLLHPELVAAAWLQRGNDGTFEASLPKRAASATAERSGSGTTGESAPAPSGAVDVAADAAVPLAPVEPPERDVRPPRSTVVLLVERGDQMLATGDVASARLFYERAAAQGSAAAAAAVGKTHDPLYLRGRGVHGVPANADQAEAWYRRAAEAGDDEARLLLQELRDWRSRAAR